MSTSQEFALVGDGTLSGSANGLFEFNATVAGTLDCSTKKFVGRLDGSAKDVFGLLLNQMFDGTMTADYDAKLHSLVNGKWTLMSRDANASDAGAGTGAVEVTGNGDWNGELTDGGAQDAGP